MKAIDVITEGSVQSVQLPQDWQISGTKVFAKRIGRSLLLIPADSDAWQMLSDSLEQFTDDYMEDRAQPGSQQREAAFE